MNDQINFDRNWNCKLYCNCFTTIRPRNDEKHQLNHVYEVKLKEKDMGNVEIVFIKHFKLKQLTEAMALVDTGYPKDRVIEIIGFIYPEIENILEHEFTYMILERTEKDINHKNQYHEIKTLQTSAIPLSG